MYKKIADREELQAHAAILVAEDKLSDTEIAQRCGITRRTLMRWKNQLSIQQKIHEHLRLSKQESERQMMIERHMRIASMEARLYEIDDIIRKRAQNPEMQGVPGGSTGVLRQRKVSCRGGKAVYAYELDTSLLREYRQLLMAVAKALGQWQPKYQPIASSTSAALPSGKKHQAALLIADGTKSDLKIAAACRVNRRTLARWKEQPSF